MSGRKTKEKARQWKIQRLTDEDVDRFVESFITDKVFTNSMIDQRYVDVLTHMVFLPLHLGVLSEAPRGFFKQIGCLWEFTDKSIGTLKVGNLPIFLTCQMMHRDDWAKVLTRLEARADELAKGPEVVATETEPNGGA